MKKATQFEIVRAEGPSNLCGKPQNATTWQAADKILKDWALTAPKEGGYDKCDFTVTWEDGETYKGRYDLKYYDINFSDLLGRHIREYLQFYTGTHKPDWMKPAQYDEAMRGVNHEDYINFLAEYEIGY